MAGTLFGLGLSQRFDSNGRPLVSAKLKVYNAGTTTPAKTFTNFALSQEQPWPLETNSSGTIPQFWVADGSYRARFETSAGVVVFDEDSITAIGASSGSGGGDTTPAAAIYQTGNFNWQPISGTRSGWVRANARTIGSVSSGATERANADVENLFLYLWGTFSNTLCPVSGGRGASAAADWAANKTIGTLDLRKKAPFGLDDMGNTAAGGFAGVTFDVGDAVTAASMGGAALHILTEAQLPALTKNLTINANTTGITATTGNNLGPGTGSTGYHHGDGGTGRTVTINDPGHPHTGTVSFGSGAAHNNMPHFVLGTWFIRI